jgi:hypothetical protein
MSNETKSPQSPEARPPVGDREARQPDGDRIGEGNYDATKRYREGLEESVRQGRAEELGEKAKEALEGEEGDELREAEERAKKG